MSDSQVIIVAIVAGAILASSIGKQIASVLKARSREQSRREIAAYIAEGSMTPEQGERLMRAGERPGKSGDE
jgi:uncharacterized membrane protein